jgi:acyl carrier protein
VPSLEEKVRQIVTEQLGLEASEVKLSTSFVDDLGADSLDLVEVVIRLEEAFALKNPEW